MNLKRRFPVSIPPAVLHRWQTDPAVLSFLEIDLSNRYTQHLPSLDRRHISQCNAQVLIPTLRTVLRAYTLPTMSIVQDALNRCNQTLNCSPVLELSDCCTVILFGSESAQQVAVLNCHVQWSRRLLSSHRSTLERICKSVACCTSSSDAALVPLPRHRHAAPTPPRRRSHATQTPHQPALMPPSPPMQPPRRSHVAPTPPKRCCNATPTPSPRRRNAAAKAAAMPPSLHLHAPFTPPRCTQLSRRPHSG